MIILRGIYLNAYSLRTDSPPTILWSRCSIPPCRRPSWVQARWRNSMTISASSLSPQRFLPCILNGHQDTIGIHCSLVSREYTVERAVRGQFTLLEQRPHLARKLGLQKLRREAAERTAEVVHVPLEHRERTVVRLSAFL